MLRLHMGLQEGQAQARGRHRPRASRRRRRYRCHPRPRAARRSSSRGRDSVSTNMKVMNRLHEGGSPRPRHVSCSVDLTVRSEQPSPTGFDGWSVVPSSTPLPQRVPSGRCTEGFVGHTPNAAKAIPVKNLLYRICRLAVLPERERHNLRHTSGLTRPVRREPRGS
jgi:hypothetical protein